MKVAPGLSAKDQDDIVKRDGGNKRASIPALRAVLSSKDSSLYYSNNWAYDTKTLAWKTVMQAMPNGTAVVIG